MKQQGEHKKIESEDAAPLPDTPHLGPVLDEETNREIFGAHELAIVLSRYDLGGIDQIQIMPIGSRRAPKVRRPWYRHLPELPCNRRSPNHH